MNGFLKEEHDSDVEVLNPQVLKKEWLTNQVCLATQLMNCGKSIPKQWVEFEKFVHENIDWQPSFGLISSLWTKMCMVEENTSSPTHDLHKNGVPDGGSYEQSNAQKHVEDTKLACSGLYSDSSLSSNNNSKKGKKRKTNSQSSLFEESFTCDKAHSMSPSPTSLSPPEKELTNDSQTSFTLTPKKKKNLKNKLADDGISGAIEKEILNSEFVSSPLLDQKSTNMSSETNNDTSFPKKYKKKRKTVEFSGSSSPTDSDNLLLNDSNLENEDCHNQCNLKKKKRNKPNENSATPNNSKKNKKKSTSTLSEPGLSKANDTSGNNKKKKKSVSMSEAEADALREELLADRILELELPTVLKEMKGAITKIDKCISSLEIKGKLKKMEKKINKIEKKSIIKKLDKRKSV